MKTIFVTVSEFLKNGGKLNLDRDIYTRKHADAPFYKVGTFNETIEPNDDMVFIQQTNKKIMLLYQNQVYVEIECKPIWK